MAIPSDIDTKAIAGKYLSRQTTGVRLNQDSDTAEENQAVLESIAISILLNPQAVLSIILRAKNTLQQLITADMDIIDYVTAAISETQNPDMSPASTADLVDAQTALVELDRIGRIDTELQSFTRYQNAINNFLNNQLAPLVKRVPNGTFNRSGLEAKQDLFNSVGLFTQTHLLLAQRMKDLAASVSDFNGVDLSQVVHTQTIARVRTSLSQIKVGMDTGGMSNTVAALELLGGSAALQSIANTKGLYDPTIETGTIPVGNTYQIGPEPTAAFTDSGLGPLLTTGDASWQLTLNTNGGGAISHVMPKAGRANRPFLVNTIKTLNPTVTFNIPVGYKLYVEITPGAAPGADGITHYEIPLTSGVARTQAQVIADINAVLLTGGVAADFDNPIGYIILSAGAGDTLIQVREVGPGSYDTLTGVFTPSAPSGHAILGFRPNQASTALGSFSFEFLQLFFQAMFTGVSTTLLSAGVGPLRVTSNSTVPLSSSLLFSGTVASDFGFATTLVSAIPLAMLLIDQTGAPIEPTGVGLLQGSVVHAAAFINPITGFDGNRILFSVPLPLVYSPLSVLAPTVVAVQQAMSILGVVSGSLDGDILPLQGLLSPLLTTPSLAQVNDALRAFATIRANLQNIFDNLSAIVVSEAQQPADATAESVIHTLEERGLDRALDLLSQCLFSDFFGLTSETVSKSTHFMKSMETVVTTDLGTSTVEADMPDGNILQGSSPSSVLTDKEVP